MQQVQLTAALSGNGPSPDTRYTAATGKRSALQLQRDEQRTYTPDFLFEEHVKGASGIHNGSRARARVCPCVHACVRACVYR